MPFYFAYGSNLYTRFQGAIEMSRSVLTAVWIYTVVHKREFIPPSQEYLGILQRAARGFDFPEAYRVFLDGIVTVPDHQQC